VVDESNRAQKRFDDGGESITLRQNENSRRLTDIIVKNGSRGNTWEEFVRRDQRAVRLRELELDTEAERGTTP
jgi:hypothetical protein